MFREVHEEKNLVKSHRRTLTTAIIFQHAFFSWKFFLKTIFVARWKANDKKKTFNNFSFDKQSLINLMTKILFPNNPPFAIVVLSHLFSLFHSFFFGLRCRVFRKKSTTHKNNGKHSRSGEKKNGRKKTLFEIRTQFDPWSHFFVSFPVKFSGLNDFIN